ncbi:MAG TPA: hypothetical protein VEL07_01840 [Planctomycetota bacterium]|nr:hypothetical protein [Planctomycetota bacterium]
MNALIVALVLVFVVMSMQVWIVQLPFALAFGWIPFIRESFAAMSIDWVASGTAVACLLALALGAHALARRLSAGPGGWRPRWTFSALLGLFTIFASGTAMIGVIHQTIWLTRAPMLDIEMGISARSLGDMLWHEAKNKPSDAAQLRAKIAADRTCMRIEEANRIIVVPSADGAVEAIAIIPRGRADDGAVMWWSGRAGRGQAPAAAQVVVVRSLERGEDPAATIADAEREIR